MVETGIARFWGGNNSDKSLTVKDKLKDMPVGESKVSVKATTLSFRRVEDRLSRLNSAIIVMVRRSLNTPRKRCTWNFIALYECD